MHYNLMICISSSKPSTNFKGGTANPLFDEHGPFFRCFFAFQCTGIPRQLALWSALTITIFCSGLPAPPPSIRTRLARPLRIFQTRSELHLKDCNSALQHLSGRMSLDRFCNGLKVLIKRAHLYQHLTRRVAFAQHSVFVVFYKDLFDLIPAPSLLLGKETCNFF